MAKRRSTKAEERAEKKRAKLASYGQTKTTRKPSKYRERLTARRNGQPMADRSGERKPLWEHGAVPLSVDLAMFASRVQKRDESRAQAA